MYPSFSEYLQAIDLSGESLNQLRQLRPVRKADGQPYFSSGNFAVVFRMEDPQTGTWVALRCFLREVPRRRERLLEIADYLQKNPSPYLLPITYYPQELWVDTRFGQPGEFDLMTMPWAEGKTLGSYVAICCRTNDKGALTQLAHRFDAMANWLLTQPFAHGDLKPDNIMVATDGTLRLIDYDGCYVPNLHGLPSPELGSPPYRHPDRSANQYNPHLDDFSLLLLSLELHTLSQAPHLFNPMDSLLIDPTDLNDTDRSNRWRQIRQLSSTDVKARVALLEFARYTPIGPIESLKTLLFHNRHETCTSNLLIPYRQKGHWGFANVRRELIVACTYEEAGTFSEGLASVRKGGKVGYINQQGIVQIPCQYDEAREFAEGLAVVRLPDGYHYIDATGKPLSDHRFVEVGSFQDGLAMVRNSNGWGFLNTLGSLSVPCRFTSVWRFTNGVARIKHEAGYQFIDKFGQVVIEGPFAYALNFSEGLAAVEQAGKFGFINPKGQVVIACEFDEVGVFSEGLASARRNGRVGFINSSGQVVIPFQYEPLLIGMLFPFSEGLAIIRKGGKYGFINSSGQVVIPPDFDEAGNFSEGLAIIKKKRKYGFINSSGQVVIPCSFDQAYNFRRGVALVRQHRGLFYIDQAGQGFIDSDHRLL